MPATATIATCRAMFASRNQVLAPTARSRVSDGVFCTVRIRKNTHVTSTTTMNASSRITANDCVIDPTPGRFSIAVGTSLASTPSTASSIEAASASGSMPGSGCTATRVGSTDGASGLPATTSCSYVA